MGSDAIPIVMLILLVFLTWQTIYSSNRDLIRAKAWGIWRGGTSPSALWR